MAWATYRSNAANGADRVGYVTDDRLYGFKSPLQLMDLLGDHGEKLKQAARDAKLSPLEVLPIADVQFRPLLRQPTCVRDFSSFLDHYRAGITAVGREFDKSLLDLPIFYYTNHTNMIGDGDTVSIPGQCENMDYELEVACIVGRDGIDLDPEAAASYIAGYCIMNDWSARDLLIDELGRAPMIAKGKDAGMSLGPLMVTPDEIADRKTGHGFDLAMTASVNGKEYSRGNWSSINWSFAEMLAYASRNVWVRAGDVIGGGTVGGGCLLELGTTFGHERYPWLKEDDEVIVEIERLGRMRNVMKLGNAPHALPRREEGLVNA